MRLLLLSVVCVALAAAAQADGPRPVSQADTAALDKRLAELERRLAAVQKELQEVRRELQTEAPAKAAVLTPQQAVESFRQDPKRPVTVEFGVETVGWPDGPIPIGEDPMPPILADWDGWLPGGGKFTLVLTSKAIRGLKDIGVELPPDLPKGAFDLQRLSVLCKHLKGKGVRVTGVVKTGHPNWSGADYSIVVDDPQDFQINK
jgi:hypothetical protein